MADQLQLCGVVVVDDGAVLKLQSEGKSLLPIGVLEVQGEFHRGDVIGVKSLAGVEVARGLANYASGEARLIARSCSSEFERLLGFVAEPELIHRDNLVLSGQH
jgi:glutamate 5-kinase